MAKLKKGIRLGPKLDVEFRSKKGKKIVVRGKPSRTAKSLGLKQDDQINLQPTDKKGSDRLFLTGRGEKTKVIGIESTRNVDVIVRRPLKNFSNRMLQELGLPTKKSGSKKRVLGS